MAAQVRSSLAQALLQRANLEQAKSGPAALALQVAATVGTPQR
jgi:hypothetical protein